MSIIEAFEDYYNKKGREAFINLSSFFNEQKEIFYQKKIEEYLDQGLSQKIAHTKARQSWVATIGRNLEKIIEKLLYDFCKENNLFLISDKQLRRKKLSTTLSLVKRAILIDFGEYAVLPDADLIIYKLKDNNPDIIAILSIKNSFRERYTETPYWKLKLKESPVTKNIKLFMITPDNDDEISYINPPKKARIVMEYELDGIYLAKESFDKSTKVKSITNLIEDLRKLI